MKQSRLRRLVSKKLQRRLERLAEPDRAELERYAERESEAVIGRMRSRGYRLVTRLDTGEGVFVRDDDLSALHIQLPASLYRRLDAECRLRETTKRNLVIAALERYLGGGEPARESP